MRPGRAIAGGFAILLCSAIAGAGPLRADSFCAALESLTQIADGAADPAFSLPAPFLTQGTCYRSLALSGGRNVTCAWPFAYRAPEAAEGFAALLQAVSDCLGPTAKVTEDPQVNHPDFYDLKVFRVGGAEYGVSIKDKGALQETYIFLRATGR